MKIAMPVWGKRISPVLDTASSFLIIEAGNNNEIKRSEFKTKEGDVASLISYMKKNHIQVMICGALSRALKNMITASGVRVREGVTGPVDAVLSLVLGKKNITSDFLMPGFTTNKEMNDKSDDLGRFNIKRRRGILMNESLSQGMNQPVNQVDQFVDDLQNEIDREVRLQYGERFFERWKKPLYLGAMKSPAGYASIKGSCGEIMDIFLNIKDNTVIKASYTTNGCAPAQVCGSLAAELAHGKSLEEAEAIDARSIMELVNGLPEDKTHCAVLAAKALSAAVSQYRRGA